MQSDQGQAGGSPGSRQRASSINSAAPRPTSLSPQLHDPAFSNIITESPLSTATPHAYPPAAVPPALYPSPYLPRTPTSTTRPYNSHTVEDSLSQVDESGAEDREYPTVSQSSRAPLLVVKERDYAEGIGEESGARVIGGGRTRQGADGEDPGAYVFVDSPAQTPGRVSPAGASRHSIEASKSLAPLQPLKQRTIDPSYLPRPGPADAYISRFLAPIPTSAGTQPPSPEPTDEPSTFLRPAAPLRAASAPGVPLASLSIPIPGRGPPAADQEDSGTHPLFKIFSAQLDTSAEEMVRRLKEHLGEVLKVQEEVGGMHLKLEGLGMGNGPGGGMGLGIKTGSGKKDEEGKGNDGVKEMVDAREKGVEEIMAKLGTLSDTLRGYHQLGTPKMSFPPSSKQPSAYPYSVAPSPTTPAPAQSSSTSAYVTSPTTPAGRHPPGHPLGSPPRIYSAHGAGTTNGTNSSTAGQGIPSLSPPRRQQRHAPKVPSNLDQVTTADEDEEDERDARSSRGEVPDGHTTRNPDWGRGKGGDVWLERKKQDLGGATQGFHESPMEMADRSRPW